MSERLHCDYCDKYIRSDAFPPYTLELDAVYNHPERIPHLFLQLCSEECLKKSLNLGDRLLELRDVPDDYYLEKYFKEREQERRTNEPERMN